jgi:hypothetical protein
MPEESPTLCGQPECDCCRLADKRIAELGDQNGRLHAALGWFLDDERFQVTVGGNPNVVEPMIAQARQIYETE